MTDQATATPSDTTDPVEPAQNPPQNAYEDLLTTITRDDGTQKYDSVDKALQSINPAQEHLSKVEQENAQLKEELAKRSNSEDILNQIVSATKTPTKEAPPVSQGMDEEAINQIVTNALINQSKRDAEETNRTTVAKAISKEYGEKSSEVYRSKLEEIGISSDAMSDLIVKSPNAALNLLGINGQSKQVTPKIQGSVNTEALKEGQAQKPKAILNDHTLTYSERLENWRAHRPSNP